MLFGTSKSRATIATIVNLGDIDLMCLRKQL